MATATIKQKHGRTNNFIIKMKEFKFVQKMKDTKPHLLYNFLSHQYLVMWFFSDITFNKLNKSHEIII